MTREARHSSGRAVRVLPSKSSTLLPFYRSTVMVSYESRLHQKINHAFPNMPGAPTQQLQDTNDLILQRSIVPHPTYFSACDNNVHGNVI